MDDFFQYLIYFIIIISFLSSLFRKKDKAQTKTGTQSYNPPLETKPQPKSSQQEEYDILREIESLFKNGSSQQSQKQKDAYKEEDFETVSEHIKTEDWTEQTKSEHISNVSEHSYENWDVKKTRFEESRKAVNEKIIRQAEMFERNLKQKKISKIDYNSTIRKRLKDPASLKDYIIISEILGKPKAFQE